MNDHHFNFKTYFRFGGLGRIPIYFDIMLSMTSSAPPPIDTSRKSLQENFQVITFQFF